MNMDAMRYRERQAIFGVYVCVGCFSAYDLVSLLLLLLAGNWSQTATDVLQIWIKGHHHRVCVRIPSSYAGNLLFQ